MAAPVNDRDVLIVNSGIRDLDPKAGKSVRIAANGALFHVNADGTPSKDSIVFTAILSGIVGVVNWNTSDGAVLTGNEDNTRALLFENMPSDMAYVTASLVIDGQTYTDTVSIAKVKDAEPGGPPGAPGAQYAMAELFKWSSAGVMDAPTGTSTLTWSNGANTSYVGTDGWYTAGELPANPGTSGIKLWVASRPVSAPGGTFTSSVTYTVDTTVAVYSQNGAQGAAGVKSATVRAYAWSNGPAPVATGTGTFTYAANDYNNLPAEGGGAVWTKTKTTAPAIGYTLYEASVSVVNTNGTATTTFDWANAVVVGIGYIGLNGTGTTGDSATIAYVLATGMSLDTTPATITRPGKNKPQTGAWGSGTNPWQDTPPTPEANQSVFQSNGIYNAVTNETTWSVPYLSNLRVGVLSAISANMGAITAGSMNINNKFTVSTTGDVEARSITIKAADGTTILSSGVALNPAYAAPGTLNSEQTWGSLNNRPLDVNNLVVTPSFEDGTIKTWAGNGASVVATDMPSATFPNKYHMRVTTRDTLEWGNGFPVTPGEKFYTSAYFYTGQTDHTVGLGLVFLDVDGQIINFVYGGGVAARTNAWTKSDGSVIVPAHAVKATTWVHIDGFENLGYAGVCNMIISRSQPGATVGAQWGVNVVGSADVDAKIAAARQVADAAKGRTDSMANDGVLDRTEKKALIADWDEEDRVWVALRGQAAALGVSHTDYDIKHSAVSAYLTSLNPSWSDTTTDTAIDRFDFRSLFAAMYEARVNLQNTIAAKAGTTASWGGVEGRPDDALNMVRKGNFEDGLNTGWTGSIVTVSGKPWTKAMEISNRDYIHVDVIPVTPGEVLYIECDIETTTTSYTCGFGFLEYNSSGSATAFRYAAVDPGRGWTKATAAIVLTNNTVKISPWATIQGPANQNIGTARFANLRITRFQSGATVGATIGSNLAGQFNEAEVATRFIPGSITDTQIGGNLKSTNWNGSTGPSGAGWLLERSTGNFYGNNIELRGKLSSGSIYRWEWAPKGQFGFYLGYEGFIMGDYGNNKYFQVTNDGNVYAPGFRIENGNATFSGSLQAASGTFNGALQAATGTFSGELKAATGTFGLIRSATSGQRTEYDSNGIRVYNAAGTLIVRLGVW